MDHTIMTSAKIEEFGRMDAGFFVLHSKHEDAYRVLMEKFSVTEMIELAHMLPFDAQAAKTCVRPSLVYDPGEKHLFEWMSNHRDLLSRRRAIAVYVSAAIHNSVAKQLMKLIKIGEQKLAIMNQTVEILKKLKEHPALVSAAKGEKTE